MQDIPQEEFELGFDGNIKPLELYQLRVALWVKKCFGDAIAGNKFERNCRFLEESLELVQACNLSKQDALKLVDYVYSRPLGEQHQEVGGVMVTLAALCQANDLNMMDAGEGELKRVWGKIDQIRAKQAAKDIRSPLPIPESQP